MTSQLVGDVSVTLNGKTPQVYFPLEFTKRNELVFPPIDDHLRAMVIPHTGILLFSGRQPPEFPLQIRHPRRIEREIKKQTSINASESE